MGKDRVYPYVPNSAPDVKAAMLEEIGAKSVEDFYDDVPEELRLGRRMELPDPFPSEYALKRHVNGLLGKNTTCQEFISFLGAGCYHHHVPAICDEVNRRGEFLTAYAGEPYDDHGRFQTLWEYCSMMGEMLNMDVVNVPCYDWLQAAATACRMAARMSGRTRILVARSSGPERISKIVDYCKPELTIELLDYDPETGQLDLEGLHSQLADDVAAVYFENPSFLGVIEERGADIAKAARECGAETIVGVDPISLGVLTPPADYGADIVCGDVQALGVHMQFGGGTAGFIASRDEVRYVQEYPSRLFGIAPTSVPGEYGFGDVLYDRTSFGVREKGKEFVGTAAALWGITAGVYLALMGPKGMQEIGEGILQRAHYATLRLSKIPGIKAPAFSSSHFREFAVNFDGTGKSVEQINAALLEKKIFGGVDLSKDFSGLGESALYCVTEVHTQSDIDTLVDALADVVTA
jgi:glycine dehydrogenase subunit 1